jgi:hypothetical protein
LKFKDDIATVVTSDTNLPRRVDKAKGFTTKDIALI